MISVENIGLKLPQNCPNHPGIRITGVWFTEEPLNFNRQKVMNINGHFRHGNGKYLIFHSYDKIYFVIIKMKTLTA
jgi:hypothetical protein